MTIAPPDWRNWSPAAQARALDGLRRIDESDWKPFYCTRLPCDGLPHDTWKWNHARTDQHPPKGEAWRVWLIRGGRGSGKTRSGTEYINRRIEFSPIVALIAPKVKSARDVMIEGEALALDTLIATPSGWTTMGEVQEGDLVIGRDGLPAKVEWCSPVAADRPCYRITLRNGQEFVADAEHKWLTEYINGYVPTVRSTQRLAELVRADHSQSRVSIRLPDPLDLPEVGLPIHPYALGVWLGDGHSKGAAVTTMDHEVLDGLIASGHVVREWASSSNGKAHTYGILGGFLGLLRAEGLLHNKHVPEGYLRASYRQRLDLLRGLMDTDGTVTPRGQCQFDNTNFRLAQAVADLLATFGIKARVSMHRDAGTGHREAYRVSFTTSLPVVTIRRKVERLTSAASNERLRVGVLSVEPVESVPVRCIRVESEDHLFLIGRTLIPTHNSGILAKSKPGERPDWEPSKRRLTWPNGAIGYVYSAEEPEELRGPQHYDAWLDEPAHMPLIDLVWSNLNYGLRLKRRNHRPKIVCTTTPLPIKWIKDLVKNPRTISTVASTYDNIANLDSDFAATVLEEHEGTRKGRQEIYGEILQDVEGALWTNALIEDNRDNDFDILRLERVVVSIDPAGTANARSDETGIMVIGLAGSDLYVLEDATGKYSPNGWAQRALDLVDKWHADYIVAEKNYGGDMVRAVLESAMKDRQDTVRIQDVTSRKGKVIRADPVVALYEKRRVHHVGVLAELEDEQTSWIVGKPSPNRVDALVHGITDLKQAAQPVSTATPQEYLRRKMLAQTATQQQRESA